MRRFVRRHRIGTAVAALVVALVAGGTTAAVWQARRAERERARAQQRFQQVRQLANYVIYDLQDATAKLAGATELRKKMVERSIVYVDSLAAEASGDDGLQIELAGAYMRLGDVLGKPSSPNLGDPDGALRSYAKGRALFEQVITRAPQDGAARRGLGHLLLNVHTTLLRYRPDDAPAVLQEALRVWEDLAREDPGREENLRGLASTNFAAGVARPNAKFDPVHMERALAIFRTLLERRPDDADRRRNVALCHKYLAGYYALPEAQDWARALQHGDAAARIDSERVQAEPDNAQARLDYAFDLGFLGDYHRNRGELRDALHALEESLALRRQLWAADQADVNPRDRFAYMLMKVAEVHMLMGDAPAAAPLLREAIVHARAVPAENFGSRLTLTKAFLFQGLATAAAGGDSCPSYRAMAALYPKLSERDVTTNFDRITGAWRDRGLQRAKSCPPGPSS
jgi:tetratricopeptide (TPR) repeat protein